MDSADELDLPRKQVGPNPQHLLITLLGDFWHGRAVPIPSAALVDVLGEFGISPASARSALSRLARRGILSLHRDGRSTAYSVREEFLQAGAERAMRNLRLGADGHSRTWDGRCVIVTAGPMDDDHEGRQALAAYLRSAGFAALQGGTWASVSADEAEVRARLVEHGLPGVLAFSAHLFYPDDRRAGSRIIQWPIDGLVASYRAFIDEFESYCQPVVNGLLPPREALVVRTRMMDSWRSIVREDPDLPDELLPADWPRPKAREIFAELYDQLGPLAEARCRQLIAVYAPDVAAQTTHMTVAFADRVSTTPGE